MKKNRLYSLCMSSMIAAAIAVQVPIARAELIATDAVAQDTAAQDRAKIDAFLDRASVKGHDLHRLAIADREVLRVARALLRVAHSERHRPSGGGIDRGRSAANVGGAAEDEERFVFHHLNPQTVRLQRAEARRSTGRAAHGLVWL